MSIERELREIKAEVEKLERVANSRVELEDLTDRQQDSIEWWEDTFKGKVVSIVEDGNSGYDAYIRVRDTEIWIGQLEALVRGPGFHSIDFQGKVIVVNF